MVPIEGGTFIMGAQKQDRAAPGYDAAAEANEAPAGRVEITSFWIHQHEGSVTDVHKCLVAGGCSLSDIATSGGYFDYPRNSQDGAPQVYRKRHDASDARGHGMVPVNGVSWYGARDYCSWIGARLPSEAEWEYVASGGAKELRFPWLPDVMPTCEHLSFKGTASEECGYEASREVNERMRLGEHPVFFVVHIAGNVWEWVSDWYAPSYNSRTITTNPTGPPSGSTKVQRGGGWSDEELTIFRTSHRAQMAPDLKLADVGFRCAASSIQ